MDNCWDDNFGETQRLIFLFEACSCRVLISLVLPPPTCTREMLVPDNIDMASIDPFAQFAVPIVTTYSDSFTWEYGLVLWSVLSVYSSLSTHGWIKSHLIP